MIFGKNPVNSFLRTSFLKKKFTNARTHSRIWLPSGKSIINRIIKEIRIHKFNTPKFSCSMHLSYEITQSTKGK